MAARREGVEGLILDIDGTLTDSNDIHAEAWQKAFEHFGKQVPLQEVRSHIGKGGDLLVPDLLNGREMRRFGKELGEYRKRLFQDSFMERIRPFPDVRRSLLVLKDQGIRLVLASSGDADEVRYYVELMDIKDIIEGHTSKKDAEFSKPSPEIFEAALKKLKTAEDRTAAIGDTPYDVLAAHRAALPIIAVLSGGFPRESLMKAEFVWQNLDEAVRRIGEVDDYFNE